MDPTANVQFVREIMLEFARETGLAPEGESPQRYFWTDAIAACA